MNFLDATEFLHLAPLVRNALLTLINGFLSTHVTLFGHALLIELRPMFFVHIDRFAQ